MAQSSNKQIPSEQEHKASLTSYFIEGAVNALPTTMFILMGTASRYDVMSNIIIFIGILGALELTNFNESPIFEEKYDYGRWAIDKRSVFIAVLGPLSVHSSSILNYYINPQNSLKISIALPAFYFLMDTTAHITSHVTAPLVEMLTETLRYYYPGDSGAINFAKDVCATSFTMVVSAAAIYIIKDIPPSPNEDVINHLLGLVHDTSIC